MVVVVVVVVAALAVTICSSHQPSVLYFLGVSLQAMMKVAGN